MTACPTRLFVASALALPLLLLAASGSATAAVAGAKETFATKARADAWTVYDYADEEFYLPEWDEEGEFIHFAHLGDEPLWFLATDLPANSDFLGNYAAAGITGLSVDAYIEDRAELDLVDCAIYTDGPAGLTYYYGTPYLSEDLEADGWQTLRFAFDETWYYHDGEEYIEVTVTQAMLAAVEEIGFRFFPQLDTATNAVAAIDDVLLEAAGSGGAAVPGAWETFATAERAEAWSVYDYADEEFYIPEWDETGEYIYFTHEGDQPLWFIAGDLAGSEALVGDYTAAGIQAIWTDAYVADLAEFDLIDCAIYASGPAGMRYYYSTPYHSEDLTEEGWQSLRFAFDETWYYYEDDEYIAVAMTEATLDSVEEIGFRFFPRVGTTVNAVAAIDDVLLEPTVEAPELQVTKADGVFRLEFAMQPGTAYTVEQLQLPAMTWAEVAGQIDLTGTGSHVYAKNLTPGTELFRVQAEAWYTPIGAP